MRFAVFVVLSTLVSSTACARPVGVRLYGQVVDRSTKEPAPGVRIIIRELKRGAISRADGSYAIPDIPHGVYTLVANAIGYRSDSMVITITNVDVKQNFSLLPESVKGGEVTIIGKTENDDLTSSAQSVSVLDQAKLDEHRGQTLGETIREIPGVTLLTTGASISKPIIRGLHSDRIVVINAGVTQEGQQWGAEHAPEIDPFAASRIEVIKGANGVEYGAGAIGGVINIQPRAFVTEGIGGELSLNGFSNNQHLASALLLEGKLFEGWGWRVQGSARKAGNSRTPDYLLGNTGFKEINGSAALGYHTPGFGLEAYYSHFGTELGIFSGSHIGNTSDLLRAIARGQPEAQYSFTYDIAAPKQKIFHDLVSVRAEYLAKTIGTFEFHADYQQNDRNEYDAHVRFRAASPTDPPATSLLLQTQSAELKLHHLPIEGLFGTVGFSASHQDNTVRGRTILIPPFRLKALGAYIVEHYLLEDWTFDAGARFDLMDRTVDSTSKNRGASLSYSNMSGALGTLWHFADTWSLSGSAGMAWRPPAVNELFSDNVHHGTAQFEIGDPSLAKEASFSVDLTLRHQSGRARAELSVYRNHVSNYIYLQPIDTLRLTIRGAFPTFRFKQTNAELLGAEAVIEYQLFAPLRVGATFSLVRGNDLLHHEPLFQMPADRLAFTAHYDLLHDGESTFKEVYAEVTARGVARQTRIPTATDYAPPPPGYVLLNTSLVSSLDLFGATMHASLSCENLLNRDYRDYLSRYRYFASDPGRTIILRLSVPFGNASPHLNE
jgi:iron complex outermembrane recepter protein